MSTLNSPEPAPRVDDAGPECWPAVFAELGRFIPPEVAALLRERDAQGRAKYGVPLRVWDGRDAIVDPLQEAMDLLVYLQRALMRVPEPDPRQWSPYHLHDKLRLLRGEALRMVVALHDLHGDVPRERP